MTFPITGMCNRKDLTYITSLSSPAILRESDIETPTLDSQYNKRTKQISVVTVIGELDDHSIHPIIGAGKSP